jgi:hypothetical protein
MRRDFEAAVRAAILWLPEAEEVLSHGAPNFRVRGKTFASFVVNHHGDGRAALWLNLPNGAQETYVAADPKRYFVPPNVGPRGWLGVDLNRGLAWKQVVARIREAYENVAPAALQTRIGPPPSLEPPTRRLSVAEIDPLQSPRGKAVLKTLRSICMALPETREALNFGSPVWQAGSKTFAWVRVTTGGLSLWFWVGVETQGLLTADERFRIPPYLGSKGWIELDVSHQLDHDEVAAMAVQSYRHFALRRMLRALADG